MTPASRLANKIKGIDFVVTAEYLPRPETNAATIQSCAKSLSAGTIAVNVADNHYGIAMSSLAAAVALSRLGIEPVYQIVTRDRNRIALQSDLLGASLLGIKNVLCLSGYHQTLMGCPESANVFDIDSIQLLAMVKQMNEEGSLLDGTKIEGQFSMLIGAVANPWLQPLELNMIRLNKKIDAGASCIQTQVVFHVEDFRRWLEALHREGITQKVAILAGVMPLASYTEAKRLADTFTDFSIPAEVLIRMQAAGSEEAQKKEGITICSEIIRSIKGLPGLRGVHLLSGGNEAVVPEIIAQATLLIEK
jgi:methylenetetrahydrofolate reductase (NADPH)